MQKAWRAAPGAGLFAAFALGLVLSGLQPDPRLWGVNSFAFLPRPAWFVATLVLFALLFPPLARAGGRGIEAFGALVLRHRALPLAAAGALLAAAFTWRMGYPFQGDGMVWLGALKEGKEFHHFEPLAAALVRAVATAASPESPEAAAGLLSILLGPLYVLATAFLCRSLFAEGLSVGVAWLLLLLHPLLLLFFGYVESYPLVIVFQAFFALALVANARRQVPWVVPALVLGLAMAVHMTALAWSPALLALAWRREPRQRRRGFLVGATSIVLASVVAVAAAGAVGSRPSTLLANLLGEPGLGGQSLRWMFSWRHGVDLVNELTLLLAPALLLLAGALSAQRLAPPIESNPTVRKGGREEHASPVSLEADAWRAIVALLPGPLAVALLVEPRIGGGRDWDLYLPLVLPAVLLAVRTWRSATAPGVPASPKATRPAPGERRTAAWADAGRTVGLAAVSYLGWLAVGVDESLAARRLEVLQEPRGTFSNFARGYANETLGIYYRGRDSNAARAAWIRATQANPANPRYFNNLGIEELRRDDVDAACAAFHRTLELGMDEYFVIYNVANCERRAGAYETAEKHYDRLVSGWPRRWEAFGARADVRVNLGRPAEALDDLQVALRLAPNVAGTHATLGLAYLALGRQQEARQAWERALALDPANDVARRQLELLQHPGE